MNDKKIHFDTGRLYRRGQRITAFTSGDDVFFVDHSRGVDGVIRGASKIHECLDPVKIMAVYDSGLYDYTRGMEERQLVHDQEHLSKKELDHLFKKVFI